MSSALEYILAIVLILLIANFVSSGKRSERTYLFSRLSDNLDSLPVVVRVSLEANKKGIKEYLDSEWDNDLLKLPMITEIWSQRVYDDISRHSSFSYEFALDFVRHVIENHEKK